MLNPCCSRLTDAYLSHTRVYIYETYFTFNLHKDANRWMQGADKSKKKRKHNERAARRAPTSKSRRRTWRDFMPAKICRVIDSNMAVTSCKLSCYTVCQCRPLETRWNDHDQIGQAGRQAGRQAGIIEAGSRRHDGGVRGGREAHEKMFPEGERVRRFERAAWPTEPLWKIVL